MKQKTLAVGLVLAMSGLATTAEAAEATRKDIVIASPHAQPAPVPATPLTVDFRTSKSSYMVGESIGLELQASKDVNYYLFRIDGAGNARLLLPGNEYPLTQAKANQRQALPAIQFTTPGVENLMLVSSTQPLQFIAGKDLSGGIPASELQQQFRSKNIGWVDNRQPTSQTITPEGRETITQQLLLNIVPATVAVATAQPVIIAPATVQPVVISPQPVVQTPPPLAISSPPPAADCSNPGPSFPGVSGRDGMVLVTTSKRCYQIGESVQIVYGATSAGYLYLYVEDEVAGTMTKLLNQRIEPNRLYSFPTSAEPPAGKLTLHAFISTTNAAPDYPADKSTAAKGLRATNTGRNNEALHTILITPAAPR